MKRYTIQLDLTERWPGPTKARMAIYRVWSGIQPPVRFELGQAREDGPRAEIELKTDAGRTQVQMIMKDLEREIGAQVVRVKWGWRFTAGAGANGTDNDPYAAAVPQAGAQAQYAYGLGQWLAELSAVIMIVILGWILWISGGLMNLFCSVPVGLTCAWLVYALTQHVTSVACSETGVTLTYWFRFTRQVGWDEIVGLQLQPLGPDMACLHLRKGDWRFPVDDFSGLQERPTLFKTIITRAELQFVERALSGRPGATGYFITYRRADADA